jgi:DNA-binding transcriptional ArsR family regulator
MEMNGAVARLGALAHETRLRIFRTLVQRGPSGIAAGRIGRRLELPGPTLSFHLAQLKQAGLVRCRREGRSLIYSADFGEVARLVAYLTQNCCAGACAPPRERARA